VSQLKAIGSWLVGFHKRFDHYRIDGTEHFLASGYTRGGAGRTW
jgi:hypothetical protein